MTEHADRALLEEMPAPLGGVSVRWMVGSLGLFRDGVMFGLALPGAPYLKAAPGERAAFAAEGGAPFSYARAGGRVTVIASDWRAPDRLADDPEEFAAWALRPARRWKEPTGRSRRGGGGQGPRAPESGVSGLD